MRKHGRHINQQCSAALDRRALEVYILPNISHECALAKSTNCAVVRFFVRTIVLNDVVQIQLTFANNHNLIGDTFKQVHILITDRVFDV